MEIVGIVQSLGLFVAVSVAMAAMLTLAVMGLARIERATVPARAAARRPVKPASGERPADRVSSRGGCTYR